MTPLSTNINHPFLKDSIVRLWNPTVSSTRATIATQPLREEGGRRENAQGYSKAILIQ
jgi:hypothetical protein